MKSQRIFFLMLACFLGNISSVAQPKLWEVYSTSNEPFISVFIDSYRSDSLYMKSGSQTIALHQDSIRFVVQRNSPQFAVGFLIGAVAGGVFMGVVSRGSNGSFSDAGSASSVALGIVVGGTIGGVIGSARGADTRYQIDKLDTEQKRKLLGRLFPGG